MSKIRHITDNADNGLTGQTITGNIIGFDYYEPTDDKMYIQKKYFDDSVDTVELPADPSLDISDVGKIIMNDGGFAKLPVSDFFNKRFSVIINNEFYDTQPIYSYILNSIPNDGDTISMVFNDGIDNYSFFEFIFKDVLTGDENEIQIGADISETVMAMGNTLMQHSDVNIKWTDISPICTDLECEDLSTLVGLHIIPVIYGERGNTDINILYNNVISSDFTLFMDGINSSIVNSEMFKYYRDGNPTPFLSFRAQDLIDYDVSGGLGYYSQRPSDYWGGWGNTTDYYETWAIFAILEIYIDNNRPELGFEYDNMTGNPTIYEKYTQPNELDPTNYNAITTFGDGNWITKSVYGNVFEKKPIGVLKEIKNGNALIDKSLIVSVKLDVGEEVYLPEPNENDDTKLMIAHGGYVNVKYPYNTELELQENFPYLIPLENGNDIILAKWHDDYVKLPDVPTIYTTNNVIYVSNEFGDDSTGEAGNINKPFKNTYAALNLTNLATQTKRYLIILMPNQYANSLVLKNGVDYYCQPGVTLLNGITGTNSGSSNVYGYANIIANSLCNLNRTMGDIFDTTIEFENFTHNGSSFNISLFAILNSVADGNICKFNIKCNDIQYNTDTAQFFNSTFRGNLMINLDIENELHISKSLDFRNSNNTTFNLNCKKYIVSDLTVTYEDSTMAFTLNNIQNSTFNINCDVHHRKEKYNWFNGLIFVNTPSYNNTFNFNGDVIADYVNLYVSATNINTAYSNKLIFNNSKISCTADYMFGETNDLIFNNCFINYEPTNNNSSLITFSSIPTLNNKPIMFNNCRLFINMETYLLKFTYSGVDSNNNKLLQFYNSIIYYKDGMTNNMIDITDTSNTGRYRISAYGTYCNIPQTNNKIDEIPSWIYDSNFDIPNEI